METAARKVHPNCVYRSNPYHVCVESCFLRMEEAGKVQKPKKNPGSLILVLPRKLSFSHRKKKGSEADMKPSNSFDRTYDLKNTLVGPESPSSPTKFSFEKVQSWNCDVPFTDKDTEKNYSKDASFVKFLPKSKPAPNKQPSDEPKEVEAAMNGDRHDDDKMLEDNQTPVDSFDSTGNEGIDTTEIAPFEVISDDETSGQPIICDSRVQVGDHYHVKGSVASILRSILNKYGDIAENCKLASVVMRSNYLECLCLIIRELQTSSPKEISKSKLKEMSAITNDVESVGIEVGWLQKILNEIMDMVELVKQGKSVELSKKKCEADIDTVRKDMETRLQDLAEKEKELADAKALVEETRERLSKLEQDSSRLDEAILSIKTKVNSIHCKAKVEEIL